jgi:hypothetical protein
MTLMPMTKSAYRLPTPWVFTISHSLIAASSRLLQHQPQVEAAAHLVSLERASAPEVTKIVHGVLGRGRDAGGDFDEHLLWKVGEGSRRRHRPPSDERRAKRFWSAKG